MPEADNVDADIWEGDSPNVTIIKVHYEMFQLKRWNNARVARLCRTMRVTAFELAALAGVFNKNSVHALRRAGETEPWPPPIALHFAKMERFANELVFKSGSAPDPQDAQLANVLSRLWRRNSGRLLLLGDSGKEK